MLKKLAGTDGVAFVANAPGAIVDIVVGDDAREALERLAQLGQTELPARAWLGGGYVFVSGFIDREHVLGAAVHIERVASVISCFELVVEKLAFVREPAPAQLFVPSDPSELFPDPTPGGPGGPLAAVMRLRRA